MNRSLPRTPHARLYLNAGADRAELTGGEINSGRARQNDQTASELSRLMSAYAAAAMIMRIINGASFFM